MFSFPLRCFTRTTQSYLVPPPKKKSPLTYRNGSGDAPTALCMSHGAVQGALAPKFGATSIPCIHREKCNAPTANLWKRCLTTDSSLNVCRACLLGCQKGIHKNVPRSFNKSKPGCPWASEGPLIKLTTLNMN